MNKLLSLTVIGLLCLSVISVVALGVNAAFPTSVNSQITDSVTQASLKSSWPMFHTGVTTSTGPTSNQSLWSYIAGGKLWSSPAVADGMVYVGSYDHQVYALDATSGILVWNFTTGNIINSSPAVLNGIVYLGSNDHTTFML